MKQKCDEIAEVAELLKKRNRVVVYSELEERKKVMSAERDLIAKRVREFKAGVKCILGYLEGKKEGKEEEGFQVFVFDGRFDWERIHRIVLREIRRLEDGLPIYAYRQQILERIHGGQVWLVFSCMVLVAVVVFMFLYVSRIMFGLCYCCVIFV